LVTTIVSIWRRRLVRASLLVAPLLLFASARGYATEAAGEAAEAVPEMPNLLSIIHGIWHQQIDAWLAAVNTHLPPLLQLEWRNFENVGFAFIIAGIIGTVAIVASRHRALKPDSRLYLFMENIAEGFHDFFSQVLGEETRRYLPLVGTLFIYIFCMNIAGLVPFFKSPTSAWGINLAMAVVVFFYVQVVGISRNGFAGYLRHFLGDLPSFRELGFAIGIIVVPFMAILNVGLHILEELIKPLSLSLRLFGNIMGEDTLLAVFGALVFLIPGFVKLPLHFPFELLAIIFSTVQALIFSILAAVYILLMLPHEQTAH